MDFKVYFIKTPHGYRWFQLNDNLNWNSTGVWKYNKYFFRFVTGTGL